MRRKQETTPNSLPDWLEETTKELCFFLHGNKLIQTRWTKKERKLNRSGVGVGVGGYCVTQAVVSVSVSVIQCLCQCLRRVEILSDLDSAAGDS